MQKRIRAVIMRGGTSKGVFFKEEDLPTDRGLRDRIILRIFGSPDPYGLQIDGLGGATSSTSKVAIIGKPISRQYDVNYTFGQVSIKEGLIDYRGNCGNLSSAVGPFAIDEGMVEVSEPITRVRIFNTNTKKLIVANVPVENGKAKVEGDYYISGIPFPGAKIALEFYEPGGAVTGKLLPTGNVVDTLEIPGIGEVEFSFVDASNPVIFVEARSIGLEGTELPSEVNSRPKILEKFEKIRSFIASLYGFGESPEEVTIKSPAVPRIALVSPATDYISTSGEKIRKEEISLTARIISMGKLHSAYALTGAICTAVASIIPGTVVNKVSELRNGRVIIGHPAGVMEVVPSVKQTNDGVYAEKVTVFRTARRLIEGYVYYPENF